MRWRSTRRGRAGLTGAVLLALVAGGGCGGDATPDESGGSTMPTGALESEATTTASPPALPVDVLAAADAARAEYPQGTVHEIELEEDAPRWHVALITREGVGRELVIDANSGDITADEERPSGGAGAAEGLAEDSLDTAVAAALAESGGNRVTQASVEEVDGRPVWRVEVDDTTAVDVDAETGEVVRGASTPY